MLRPMEVLHHLGDVVEISEHTHYMLLLWLIPWIAEPTTLGGCVETNTVWEKTHHIRRPPIALRRIPGLGGILNPLSNPAPRTA